MSTRTLLHRAQLGRTPIRLQDGRVVTVRPIRRSDADGLLELHAGLSPETRRSRFFTASSTKRWVDAERLTAMTGKYDCVLIATEIARGVDEPDERGQERIVAVGQLAGYGESGESVEAALVVCDDYQGIGLGSALFRRLLQAGAQRGVRHVEATVLSGNNRILRILRHHQARLGPAENGVLQVDICHPGTTQAATAAS